MIFMKKNYHNKAQNGTAVIENQQRQCKSNSHSIYFSSQSFCSVKYKGTIYLINLIYFWEKGEKKLPVHDQSHLQAQQKSKKKHQIKDISDIFKKILLFSANHLSNFILLWVYLK